MGTSAELRAQTRTETLEAAFLALTGTSLRDESANSADAMRRFAQMWQQKR
jgi:ABC-2 type transport system ATP-binding protein